MRRTPERPTESDHCLIGRPLPSELVTRLRIPSWFQLQAVNRQLSESTVSCRQSWGWC